MKLTAERPSTAPIGNSGIVDVVHRLSEEYDLGSFISARLFMGKKKTPKSKVDFPLSKKDSEDAVRAQWEGLK